MERRDFLQQIGALGAAAALPHSALAKPYDPAAKFDLKVSDVPFRRNGAGLHGGAWTRKDRYVPAF